MAMHMTIRRSIRYIPALLAMLLLLAVPAQATDQIPDRLIYQGKECAIGTDWYSQAVLQLYFRLNPAVPRPQYDGNITWSTACYRGHVATWVVDNGELYLVKLAVPDYDSDNPWQDQKEIDCPEVLRDKMQNGRIFADWFSGVLSVFVTDTDIVLMRFVRGVLMEQAHYTSAQIEALNSQRYGNYNWSNHEPGKDTPVERPTDDVLFNRLMTYAKLSNEAADGRMDEAGLAAAMSTPTDTPLRLSTDTSGARMGMASHVPAGNAQSETMNPAFIAGLVFGMLAVVIIIRGLRRQRTRH